MKNRTLKIITFIIIVLLISMLPQLVKANQSLNLSLASSGSSGGIVAGADDFINSAKGSPIKQEGLKESSDIIYNTLMAVGVTVAMIGITVLGIKFMIGSVEEKAKVKETLIPFTIGCIILFLGFVIWRIVLIFAQNFN